MFLGIISLKLHLFWTACELHVLAVLHIPILVWRFREIRMGSYTNNGFVILNNEAFSMKIADVEAKI